MIVKALKLKGSEPSQFATFSNIQGKMALSNHADMFTPVHIAITKELVEQATGLKFDEYDLIELEVTEKS